MPTRTIEKIAQWKRKLIDLSRRNRLIHFRPTRARRKVIVLSSILPEDFDLSRTDARGVHNLKRYLEYARSGPQSVAAEAVETDDKETLFERAVHEVVSERGVKLARQVGCSGYRVDPAVEEGDGYLLGIECDGVNYHSAATARDRDRLRRQVLELLGWRLHRVWSTEWFRNPRRELERALEAVERARAGEPVEPKEAAPAVAETSDLPPAEPLPEIDHAARLLGFSRTGPRVRDSVAAAVDLLCRGGKIVEKNGEYVPA